uniref:Uncharacterized protein n=1 Tax=Rhipicephalus microplus TaxID=6941 RepID=A0A6M2DA94_RHIMP
MHRAGPLPPLSLFSFQHRRGTMETATDPRRFVVVWARVELRSLCLLVPFFSSSSARCPSWVSIVVVRDVDHAGDRKMNSERKAGVTRSKWRTSVPIYDAITFRRKRSQQAHSREEKKRGRQSSPDVSRLKCLLPLSGRKSLTVPMRRMSQREKPLGKDTETQSRPAAPTIDVRKLTLKPLIACLTLSSPWFTQFYVRLSRGSTPWAVERTFSYISALRDVD